MTGTRRYTADLDLMHLGQQIHRAERVLILTGAGISRASGLRTYRGEDGIYADTEIEALHHAHGTARLPARAVGLLGAAASQDLGRAAQSPGTSPSRRSSARACGTAGR